AYMTLAFLYQQSGETPKAIQTYEKAVAACPNVWGATNNLAFMLANTSDKKEDLQRALDLAEKAAALNTGEASVRDTLGWVYCRQGKVEQAVGVLENAIGRPPERPDIRYNLGLGWRSSNRVVEGRERLETAVAKGENFRGWEEAQRAFDK